MLKVYQKGSKNYRIIKSSGQIFQFLERLFIYFDTSNKKMY